MPSRRPLPLVAAAAALVLLGLFWALGLLATSSPDLTLTVSRAYLLTRNAVWSAGALLLAVLLLRGGRRIAPLTVVIILLWLLWRTGDRILLQTAPVRLLDLLPPAVPAAVLIGVLYMPPMRRWLESRRHEQER